MKQVTLYLYDIYMIIKPKIITNDEIQQGTEEWKQLRLGKATASKFKRIITRTGKRSTSYEKYALELAFEKFAARIPDSFSTQAMERGIALESIARQEYSKNTLTEVTEVAFFDCGSYGFSPDGLIDDDGLIEVKAMNIEKHAECFITKEVPDEHYAQCQGALMVSQRKWIDFVSYNSDLRQPLDLVIIRLFPDIEFINNLSKYVQDTINKRDEFIKLIENK